MPSKQLQPGSPSPSWGSQVIHVSPETCHDLSVFKEILKEYRRLDDSIVMRLNRANAIMLEKRIHGPSGNNSIQEEACEYIWRDLVANWKRRTQLVEYCMGVVDQSLHESRTALQNQAVQDPANERKTQGKIFADGVKRNQVHAEANVESIIRKRSYDAFKARCRYFAPPKTDSEARKLWDAASQK